MYHAILITFNSQRHLTLNLLFVASLLRLPLISLRPIALFFLVSSFFFGTAPLKSVQAIETLSVHFLSHFAFFELDAVIFHVRLAQKLYIDVRETLVMWMMWSCVVSLSKWQFSVEFLMNRFLRLKENSRAVIAGF